MVVLLGVAAVLTGCGDAASEAPASVADAIVYGSDDRLEYFDVPDPSLRAAIAEAMVAFIPKDQLPLDPLLAPTWADVAGLCPGERFADQPAIAFCSGVLVDWDLVLTASHCLSRYALEDLAVVFDYYYQAPGEIAPVADPSTDPVEIVLEQFDRPWEMERLDYAWVRLRRPVAPPRQPVPVYVSRPDLQVGDPVVSVGASGGLPMKAAMGASVRDVREPSFDYFSADADVMHGASGGGAFDERVGLLGILARGGEDLEPTAEGCSRTNYQPEDGPLEEQFTYAYRAVEDLCRTHPENSSLCRSDCEAPCRAARPLIAIQPDGCAVVRASAADGPVGTAALVALALGGWLARHRRFPRRDKRRRRSRGPQESSEPRLNPDLDPLGRDRCRSAQLALGWFGREVPPREPTQNRRASAHEQDVGHDGERPRACLKPLELTTAIRESRASFHEVVIGLLGHGPSDDGGAEQRTSASDDEPGSDRTAFRVVLERRSSRPPLCRGRPIGPRRRRWRGRFDRLELDVDHSLFAAGECHFHALCHVAGARELQTVPSRFDDQPPARADPLDGMAVRRDRNVDRCDRHLHD
jgi:hypothetical protein